MDSKNATGGAPLPPAPIRDAATWVYPEIEPFNTASLDVGGGHVIYYEESGNPTGVTVLFVHGGPGGGTSPAHRRFFDPLRYRIVLFDQRGCGKSTPHACLDGNTTWDLVGDMELLRQRLCVEQWDVVFGGSWGSTLALVYAETHPSRVKSLILRGIFLVRSKEIRWFYQEGANFIFPDAWEKYRDFIPEEERDDFVAAYHRRLTGADEQVRLAAAKAWSIWEGSTSALSVNQATVAARFGADNFALAFARIENHYFFNKSFLPTDNYILENAHRLRSIPITVVQGRYDVVCPMVSAWELKKELPHIDLVVVPDAGHAQTEPGTSKALVAAADKYAGIL
jgi:proline iminopeptidase